MRACVTRPKLFHTRRVPSRLAILAGVFGMAIIIASAGVAMADVTASDRLLGFLSLKTLSIPAKAGWVAGVIFLLPLVIEILGGFSYEVFTRLARREPKNP